MNSGHASFSRVVSKGAFWGLGGCNVIFKSAPLLVKGGGDKVESGSFKIVFPHGIEILVFLGVLNHGPPLEF